MSIGASNEDLFFDGDFDVSWVDITVNEGCIHVSRTLHLQQVVCAFILQLEVVPDIL